MHLNWNETIVLLAVVAAVTTYKVIALFIEADTKQRSRDDCEDEVNFSADDEASPSPAKSPAPGR